VSARAWIDEWSDSTDNNGLLVMDGYDDCIVGVVSRFGTDPFVVYDRTKVIKKLMADGMTYEEAVEFHEFNQIGAFVGPHTPGFIELPESEP